MKLLKTEEHKEFCKVIGANLRRMRTEKKLSQSEVAFALEVTWQQMQKYENGKNCPSAWRLKQLADFFKISAIDILDTNFITNRDRQEKL